jgi:hypothetical protein
MVLKYVRRGCGPGTERISYQQHVFFAQDVIDLPYTNYLALRVSPDLLKTTVVTPQETLCPSYRLRSPASPRCLHQ